MSLDDFRDSWWDFVLAWEALDRRSPKQASILLKDVCARGLATVLTQLRIPDSKPDAETFAAIEHRCQRALLNTAKAVDSRGYAEHQADQHLQAADSVEHYLTKGWRELRSPRADFDTWWYWCEYLDPASDDIEPLTHYLLEGALRGYATHPQEHAELPDPAVVSPDRVRRVCLFASYDPEGLLDDSLIHYLTELSRHTDIYFLADNELAEDQLAKLEGLAIGAWGFRHGRYDWGSYSLLAAELVGWEKLSEYDEVLFANDSMYLLHPLDNVFASMSVQPCDWWGLEATKSNLHSATPFTRTVALADADKVRQADEDWWMIDRPFVGSYFVAYRRRVIADAGFRQRLEAVVAQDEKRVIVYKYEIGMSDYLRKSGFALRTYTDCLHTHHPLYSQEFPFLAANGFPLMKRNLLSGNRFRLPEVDNWREWLRAISESIPVDLYAANLHRVTPAHQLRVLSAQEFAAMDAKGEPSNDVWAFPVCAYDHTLGGNDRAVFESVRHDPTVKKVILTRSTPIDLDGANVTILPLGSRAGQEALMQAGYVFTKHGPRINVPWPLAPTHKVINLWHGIPLKRFGYAMVKDGGSRDLIATINGECHAVITSSAMDSMTMASAFYPLTLHSMWATGLPRNDFITCPEERLPDDMRDSLARLRTEVGDRKLVMFLPTFKDGQADAYYDFSEKEIEQLREWLERSGAVLGVREHMADSAHSYSQALAELSPIDLSSKRFPNLEVLYRAASALLSDYSSCLVDFLLTGQPVVSFAYDYERYAEEERGLFYPLEKVLPGPVCRDFDQLLGALECLFDEPTDDQLADYEFRRSLFFDHIDDGAAARVVARVKAMSHVTESPALAAGMV